MSLTTDYQSILSRKVSLFNFLDIFSSEEECLELYFTLKFEGCACKKCGRIVTESYKRILRVDINGTPKKAFRCRACRTYIYPLSDTVFRKTSVPMKDILFSIFIMCLSKGSTSCTDMTSYVSVTYKTAHRLLMHIRYVLGQSYRHKMKGVVEVDEAFIGKGSKVYNWSGISTRKQPIIGMIERGTGHTRMFLVDNRKTATINRLIYDNIEIGSTIYTDSWRGYQSLSKDFNHEFINHSSREYVRGDIHTNGIENVWMHLKRNLRKAHIKISEKYTQMYVNEACWRRNSKGKKPMDLFDEVLRLTFYSGLD